MAVLHNSDQKLADRALTFVILWFLIGCTSAYLDFDLTHEEAGRQQPMYTGNSADELIELCKYPNAAGEREYDFTNEACVVHNISLPPLETKDERYEKLINIRRKLLKEAIDKAIGFKKRLAWPPIQLLFQMGAFLMALFGGLFLVVVGHFDMRSHYVRFFKDPTRGIPGKVFVAKKSNFWVHYWPPPEANDPDYKNYIFEESDAWSTVNESEDEKKKIVVDTHKEGEKPVELTVAELEYIRKNAEFDEYGYPFEYKKFDLEAEEKELIDYNERIKAANATIIADNAKKRYPWRNAAKQNVAEAAAVLKGLPGYKLLEQGVDGSDKKESIEDSLQDIMDSLSKTEHELQPDPSESESNKSELR